MIVCGIPSPIKPLTLKSLLYLILLGVLDAIFTPYLTTHSSVTILASVLRYNQLWSRLQWLVAQDVSDATIFEILIVTTQPFISQRLELTA
jgi:hypothetical protein